MLKFNHLGKSLILAASLVAGPFAVNAQSVSRAPLAQISDSYRFTIGDLRITALSDGTVPQDLHKLLKNTTQKELDDLLRHAHRTNPIEASINAFLIQDGTRLILVDTGSGELFGPGNGGKLVASLSSVGVRPEQINDILITHVHTDHSGGLVQKGRLTFPNATVHVAKADVDFFLDRENALRTGYGNQYFEEAIKTLKPYVDAGQVKTFDASGPILPGITASLHSGHTPGSAFFVASSRGQSITFIGDLIHVAPVQFPRPAITITYDLDPKAAAQNRMEQFARFAREATLVAAPHLPFPGVGQLRADGEGYDWLPIEYVNREAK